MDKPFNEKVKQFKKFKEEQRAYLEALKEGSSAKRRLKLRKRRLKLRKRGNPSNEDAKIEFDDQKTDC